MVIGDWASGKQPALGGGFRFIQLKREKIDAGAVNALAREEMIDLLLNSYWDKAEKARSYLHRYAIGSHKFLFATNPKNEGFFLIWDNPDTASILNRDAFKAIVAEATVAGLTERYHVYASIAPYTGAGSVGCSQPVEFPVRTEARGNSFSRNSTSSYSVQSE